MYGQTKALSKCSYMRLTHLADFLVRDFVFVAVLVHEPEALYTELGFE